FIIPCYSHLSKWKYLIGLKLYDWLAGRFRIGQSSFVSKKEVSQRFPTMKTVGLKGGVRYFDGQFDDARLAINLAQTATAHGATTLNYCKVVALRKDVSGKTSGVVFTDSETNKQLEIDAKVVINATGVFVDNILQLDIHEHRPIVKPSQGIHIVVDRS